jgi:DNA-binding NarL/FixJ family response regulator
MIPATMLSILLVDDHAGFRAQARTLLEAEGYSVAGEAPDGRTAVAAASSLRPDLMLMDIGLPDIDGFEVSRLLAECASPPLIILISSRDAAAYGPRIVASGVLGFIAKDDLDGAAIQALVERRFDCAHRAG